MAVHTFRVGKGARLAFGPVIVLMMEGTGTVSYDDLDGANTESGGVEEGDLGIGVVSVDATLVWNAGAGAGYFDNGIYPSVNVGPVLMYVSVTGNVFWNFPLIKIIQCGTQIRVRNLIMFPIRFKTQGVWSYPAGS